MQGKCSLLLLMLLLLLLLLSISLPYVCVHTRAHAVWVITCSRSVGVSMKSVIDITTGQEQVTT
jgi:predicted S18 family serine protease